MLTRHFIAAFLFNTNLKKILLFITLFILLENFVLGQPFTEVSQAVGIDFMYENEMLMGGGTAFFDFDQDGYLDVYIVGGTAQDRLYRNQGDGTFEEIGEQVGLGVTANYVTTGAITGDLDNDGFPDVFVMTHFNNTQSPFTIINDTAYLNASPNFLLKNKRDGTFEDISLAAGITDSSFSMAASFGDYNKDGYLDLYVGNYVKIADFDEVNNIFTHQGYENHFYINNGDDTFTEAAQSMNIHDPNSTTLAVTFTDYDNDADADIYVINDFGEFVEPNALFQNDFPNNSFIDQSISSGADIGIYGMGIAIGDYDEDADLDYYITNLGQNMLLQNQGDGTFLEVGEAAGVDETFYITDSLLSTSWGTAFLDYDHDTYLDLFVNNGHIATAAFIADGEEDTSRLYRNNGDGTFSDATVAANIVNLDYGRGMAMADYDNDGDLDIMLSVVRRSPPHGTLVENDHLLFYRNDMFHDSTNNWLKVKLIGTLSNRDAFGARVSAFTNGRVFIREIDGGSSHLSQHSSIAHFGLGSYTNIDSVQITWPMGTTQTHYNITANQQMFMVEDTLTLADTPTSVQIKVCLEGAFNNNSGLMDTALRISNRLPVCQPYNRPPWNYQGVECCLSTNYLPENTVDWVLVELFDPTNTTFPIAQKAGLLLSNGVITDTDGIEDGLTFYNIPTNVPYQIVVRHRNHLAVATANPINIPNILPYDFTSAIGQAMGETQQIEVEIGIFALNLGFAPPLKNN